MNYTIFSVDNSRKLYTDAIEARLDESFWFTPNPMAAVDGREDPDEVDYYISRYGFNDWQAGDPPKVGQLGIWATVLKAIRGLCLPLVTFEDDAILHPYFHRLFWDVTSRLPRDTDAFSLFLPRDQDGVYNKNASTLWVAQGVCRAYQRYGGVSMLWTPDGAKKFTDLLRRDGIRDQWDNQLYSYARNGEMNVYTQTPSRDVLVGISGTEKSIVQESDYV